MQPLYNMRRGPCSAQDSILLAYPSMSLPEITVEAFARSHWKVLYFSILSALTTTLMLVPVSALTLTYVGNGTIVGHFSMLFYIGSLLVVCIPILSCIIAWPRDRRKAPRPRAALIDDWAMFYNSRLAKNSEFARCGPDWGPEYLAATLQLRRDEYALGVCRGEDGKHSLGFDVCTDGQTGQNTGYVHHVALKSPRKPKPNLIEEGIELQEGSQIGLDQHGRRS